MGLFSKTKTYVESASSNIFTEGRSSVNQSVFGAIVRDRSISDDLIVDALNGLGRKAKQFYRYGENKYIYGLPEGTVVVKSANASALNIVIAATEDDTAEVVYSTFDLADSEMFAREFLVSERGLDVVSNVVSNPNFTTTNEVTLYSTEWVSNTQILIKYLYDTPEDLEEELITVEPVDLDEYYYHVAYVTESSPDIHLYWFYKASLGTYETLNVNTQDKVSEYYPVIPIMRDNVDLTDDSLKETELYQSSKKALSKLGISYSKLGAGVAANPDIDGVDHAYVNISAPIQSDSKFMQEYLYAYFLDLFEKQTYDKEFYEAELNSSRSAPLLNRIIVSELENNSDERGFFNTELAFSYIESEVVTGSIGKVGSVERDTTVQGETLFTFFKVDTSYMTWRKQISETQYRELKVHGLVYINRIYGNKAVTTSLEDSLSADNDDFNIMINKRVLETFPIHKQNDIVNDGVRICFNSVERVKLKWYQTTVFKILIIIVGAAISVATMGADGGGALAWAIGITGATTFLAQLAVAIILNAVLSVILSKLADVIGLENAAILAAIYTVYSIASGTGPVMTGDNLLVLASGITMASNFYLQGQYEELRNEYDQLRAEQEADQAELDELIEALPNGLLDPLAFRDNTLASGFPNETPEQYYKMRIHTGNIGTLSFEQISRYVESELRLEGITDREALNIL